MSTMYDNTKWKEGKLEINGKQYQLEKRAFDQKYKLQQTGYHKNIDIHYNETKTECWLTFLYYDDLKMKGRI